MFVILAIFVFAVGMILGYTLGLWVHRYKEDSVGYWYNQFRDAGLEELEDELVYSRPGSVKHEVLSTLIDRH